MDYYPVFLNLQDRLCVVVGGGEVAERKVEGLLRVGAWVTLISPGCTAHLQKLGDEGRIRREERPYRAGDLAGAFLVIAATDQREVNQAVAQEAEAQGTLLNVVDVTRLCSFIAPSIIRHGPVTVAISTGGLSPALAKKIRLELEGSDALGYADLIELVAEVRGEVRRRGVAVSPSRWQAALSAEVLELHRSGRREEARARLMSLLVDQGSPTEVGVP